MRSADRCTCWKNALNFFESDKRLLLPRLFEQFVQMLISLFIRFHFIEINTMFLILYYERSYFLFQPGGQVLRGRAQALISLHLKFRLAFAVFPPMKTRKFHRAKLFRAA